MQIDRWIYPKVLLLHYHFLRYRCAITSGLRITTILHVRYANLILPTVIHQDIMYKYVYDILAIDSKNPIRSKGVVILVIG